MKKPIKILVTDSIHEVFIEQMQSIGCEVHYQNTIEREQVLEVIANYEVLLINSRIKADKELIDRALI